MCCLFVVGCNKNSTSEQAKDPSYIPIEVKYKNHGYLIFRDFINTSSYGGYTISVVHDPECICGKK